MATLIFFVAAVLGLLSTRFVLSFFRKRAKLSAHQYGLILAFGMFLTWLISFFAPFLAPDSQMPGIVVTVFGIAIALSTGLLTYIIVCIFLVIRDRRK